jgi:hypothetical protein
MLPEKYKYELSRRNVSRLVDPIKNTATQNGNPIQVVNIVADILDQETASTIKEWLARINADENLSSIELSNEARSSHLPQLFKELVHRLRHPLPLGTRRRFRSRPTNMDSLGAMRVTPPQCLSRNPAYSKFPSSIRCIRKMIG